MQEAIKTDGILVVSGNAARLVPIHRPHRSDVPAVASDIPVRILEESDLAAILAVAAPHPDNTIRGTFSLEGDRVTLVHAWPRDHREARMAVLTAARHAGTPHPIPEQQYGTLSNWGGTTYFTPLVEDERGLRVAGPDLPVNVSSAAAWRIVKEGLKGPTPDPATALAGFFVLVHSVDGEVSVKETKQVWAANKAELEATVRDHMGWNHVDFTSKGRIGDIETSLPTAVAMVLTDGDDEMDQAMRAILPEDLHETKPEEAVSGLAP